MIDGARAMRERRNMMAWARGDPVPQSLGNPMSLGLDTKEIPRRIPPDPTSKIPPKICWPFDKSRAAGEPSPGDLPPDEEPATQSWSGVEGLYDCTDLWQV